MHSQVPAGPAICQSGCIKQELAERFRAVGQELYLVGGAVRDGLLGLSDLDLDFATSASPSVTAEILEGLGAGNPYRIGEKFGTIGLRVGEMVVEITTYRTEETYATGSRKPEVRFGGTLLEDLSRRDFTVNSMAEDPLSGPLIDPFGGLQDLHDHVIRAVGNPLERFREDPLRLLRAIRIAGRLNFRIDPATWEALLEAAPTLRHISRERIRDELTRLLEGPNARGGLELMRDSGLLASSVPELLELTMMSDHGPRHPLSLWDHTMRVVEGVPAKSIVRWAALLHDVAKPATRTTEPDGRPRFFHHEEVGAATARQVLSSLRYSKQQVDEVALLVETHMQLHAYAPEWSDGAVRRLMLRLGGLWDYAIALARSDAAGHGTGDDTATRAKFEALDARARALSTEQNDRVTSPLTGKDLMARYDRGPGPWIKAIKDAICEALIEGHLAPNDAVGAWRIADEAIARESNRQA